MPNPQSKEILRRELTDGNEDSLRINDQTELRLDILRQQTETQRLNTESIKTLEVNKPLKDGPEKAYTFMFILINELLTQKLLDSGWDMTKTSSEQEALFSNLTIESIASILPEDQENITNVTYNKLIEAKSIISPNPDSVAFLIQNRWGEIIQLLRNGANEAYESNKSLVPETKPENVDDKLASLEKKVETKDEKTFIEMVKEAPQKAIEFAKAHPTLTVIGGVATAYVIGKWLFGSKKEKSNEDSEGGSTFKWAALFGALGIGGYMAYKYGINNKIKGVGDAINKGTEWASKKKEETKSFIAKKIGADETKLDPKDQEHYQEIKEKSFIDATLFNFMKQVEKNGLVKPDWSRYYGKLDKGETLTLEERSEIISSLAIEKEKKIAISAGKGILYLGTSTVIEVIDKDLELLVQTIGFSITRDPKQALNWIQTYGEGITLIGSIATFSNIGKNLLIEGEFNILKSIGSGLKTGLKWPIYPITYTKKGIEMGSKAIGFIEKLKNDTIVVMDSTFSPILRWVGGTIEYLKKINPDRKIAELVESKIGHIDTQITAGQLGTEINTMLASKGLISGTPEANEAIKIWKKEFAIGELVRSGQISVQDLKTAREAITKLIKDKLDSLPINLTNQEKILAEMDGLHYIKGTAERYLEHSIREVKLRKLAGENTDLLEKQIKETLEKLQTEYSKRFKNITEKYNDLVKSDALSGVAKTKLKRFLRNEVVSHNLNGALKGRIINNYKTKGKIALAIAIPKMAYDIYSVKDQFKEKMLDGELRALIKEVGLDTLQLILDIMSPLGSTDWYTAISGKEILTGKKVEGWDRWSRLVYGTYSLTSDIVAAFASVPTAGAGGAAVYGGANILEAGLRAAGKSDDLIKTAQKLIPKITELAQNSGGIMNLIKRLRTISGSVMLGEAAYYGGNMIYEGIQYHYDTSKSETIELDENILDESQDSLPETPQLAA